MIVATAGHVDHGKSSLVRVLTGVDTDRLPEEKRRGLTIEPGFTYMAGPQGEILGFVDVPGHERFVGNMLAGVAAIDYVLFVVAADDGVMPQTREHLAILDLLNVRSGAVAITKVDRVPATRATEVTNEVTRLLEGTSLAGSSVYEVSVVSGRGVDALRLRLLTEASRHARVESEGRFRLSIDRSFSLSGAGLVVTGAVVSGTVAIGDYLQLSPKGYRVRVRDIRVHGRPAVRASAGDRAALNLIGGRLDREAALRGAWVVDGALHAPTRNLDAHLRLLPTAPKPVKHWLPVHVHLAAGHVTGHLALLGSDAIEPGGTGFVELILNEPVCALTGDRFIVRDQSARLTLGGGFVANPFAPSRGRTRAQRRATAVAMANGNSTLALAALLDIIGQEVDLDQFAIARDLRSEDATRMYSAAGLKFFQARGAKFGVAAARWSDLQQEVLCALEETHRQLPGHLGIREGTLAGCVGSRPSAALFKAALGELVAEEKVIRTGPWCHLPSHRPLAGPADLAAWRRVERIIESAGLRSPSLSALAEALDESVPDLMKILRRLECLGLIIRIAQNRFLTLRQAATLASIAEQLAAPDGTDDHAITVAAFREKSGIGRNMTIEVLEFFDRVGFTCRKGEYRRILREGREFFGEAGAEADEAAD